MLACENERCVIFCGGNKAKSLNPTGSEFAGGCTRAWWDAAVAADDAETAMGKLMGTDGEPIATVTNVEHIQDQGDTLILADGDLADGFAGVEAGMLLFHPDPDGYMSGAGLYKVGTILSSNAITLDSAVEWHSGLPDYDGQVTVYAGGAWSDYVEVAHSYTWPIDYSQDIFVNKDFTDKTGVGGQDDRPALQWDLDDSKGHVMYNTWLNVIPFHRIPGDITEPDGAYYQSTADKEKNGVDLDKVVTIDIDLITPGSGFMTQGGANIKANGFYFINSVSGISLFDDSLMTRYNLDFTHNAYKLTEPINIKNARGFLAVDSFFDINTSASGSLFLGNGVTELVFLFNHIKNSKPATIIKECGTVISHGNVWSITGGNSGPDYAIKGYYDSLVLSLNNTYTGYARDNSGALLATNCDGLAVSINDLVFNGAVGASVFESDGATGVIKNLCAYSSGGKLTNITRLSIPPAQESDIDGLLEIDPLLDSDNEPLENDVRTGGMPDVLGDPTSLGAIKTMNTTVIETIVTSAVVDIKSKTDNLPADPAGVSDLASVNTSACKLAADGLDNVVVAEPTGDPSGWSFAQCLRWLIMRFFNKHTSDNFSGIKVHKDDGSVSTTQAVTEVDGVKSVGKTQ